MALPVFDKLATVAAGTSSATKKIASKLSSADNTQNEKALNKQQSFFDKMIAADRDKQKRDDAKQHTNDVIARQDKFIEQKRLLRHIANNTDMMVDLLRDFKGDSAKRNSSILDLLKWLAPALLAATAFADPKTTKKYQTGIKTGVKAAPAAVKIAQAAAETAQASKIKKAADLAESGADASKLLKSADSLGTAAKVLGKIGGAAGKFADSKLVNNGLRITTAGMAAGRAIQGDYTGAGMEVASQGLTEVARKVKNPKLKVALTLASLGTDAAIIGRDYLTGKKEESREQFAKENGITTPEKESTITKLMGFAGVETDQAKRIKEQNTAMTPEQKAIMDKYDAENGGILGGTSAVGTITKIVSGVVLGILAGLGVKALINKRLGIPDVSTDINKAPSAKPKTNKPTGGKLSTIKSLVPMAAPAAGTLGSDVATGAAKTAAKDAAGKQVLQKGALKAGAKLIPGVGLAYGAYGAVTRAKDGDYLGAAGEAISGLATLIPGFGTAIGGVIQGGLMYRDYVKATSKDTGELNKISKEATNNLSKSATENKKTIDANGKVIQASNETIQKNSDELKKATTETGTLLKTFTNALGVGVFSWIAQGGKVFDDAFKVLSDVSGKLWNWVKNTSFGQAINNTVETIKGAIDTTAGQASLGKHGGTMTGSIFAGESGGNYGIYNRYDKASGKYKSAKVDSNNTSLNTVMGMQSTGQMNAFGAYQIIGSTMKGAKKHLGLTGNEKMTQELQDRIYQDYLIKEKRKSMYKYLTGGTDLNAAITAAAMEWASIGVPVAMKGHKRQVKAGESYYAGDGHNKAHISPAEFGEGLKQQRNRYLALRKAGLSEKDAYKRSFSKDALNNVAGIKKEDKAGTGGSEASTLQKIVNGASDTASSVKSGISNTSIGRTLKSVFSDPTAKTGVDARQPLSDKNIPAAPKKEAIKKEAAAPTAKKSAPAVAAASLASTANTASNKDGKAGMEWDLDILVSHAVKAAKPKSLGKCARYVREALEKAQIKKFFSGGLGDAKDVPRRLVQMGWASVGENIKSFKKGDIAVFAKTKSEYGHICIFTGSGWVSDFKQKQLQPYSSANFSYNVYRAKKGYTNGQAVSFTGEGDMDVENDENGNPIGGAGDDTGSAEETPKNAGEKLIDGMASLMAFLGDSDTMKSAVDWLDSIEKDTYTPTKVDIPELDGFDKNLYGQLNNGHKYKGGNGGGVNEDSLFNPNLDRQKGANSDLLGEAGKLNGIQRQQNIGRNLLGEAGYINPYTRQLGTKRDLLGEAGSFDPKTRQLASKYDLLGEAGYVDPKTRQLDIGRDLLGEAGSGRDLSDIKGTGGYGDLSRNTRLDDIVKELEGTSDSDKAKATKKKKLKWYDKLFGNSNSWLGQLSYGLGLGGLFGKAQDIYNVSKSGEWGDYAKDVGIDILNNNGLGEIAGIGSDIYNVSKSGNSDDIGGLVARTLEKVYSHKDDHLKDANGNIITNNAFNDIVNATGGILPAPAPGLILPSMAQASPSAPPILKDVAENNIIPTVKEDTNGNRTYYNGDGSTITRDFEGNIINQTPPTTDVPNRFEDVKHSVIAPEPAEKSPLDLVLANQNKYDNAFTKLRQDKINSGEIGAHTSVGLLSLTPNNKLDNGVLQPDMEGRATLDEHVAKVNRQYDQAKNNARDNSVPLSQVPADGSSSVLAPPQAGNRNGGQGNTAPLITRNPDSIFREVSMTMMRASTT